jgi:hypothetical protein
VPIHSVKIGDYILDQSSTPTRVIGTYKAKLPLLVHTTEYLTDGVWILQGDTWVLNKEGVQEVHDYEVPNKFACNLITLSGTIRIECNSTNYIVRDFTECGIDNIEGCYEVLDKVL